MPQFDPSLFAPQLVWLAITFIALYIVMAKVALPRIGQALDDRQIKIDNDLEKAAALKTDAEAAVAAYEKALTDARTQAQEILAQARDELAADAAERQNKLSERLNAEIEAGEQRIAAAKTEAMSSVRQMAIEVAGAATERLAGEAADAAAVETAVAASMKERG